MKRYFQVFFCIGVVWMASATMAGSATTQLKDKDGTEVGQVVFSAAPNGVLIKMDADGLPAGTHGFHIHETGACTPDFAAAGGHFAPDGKKHGFVIDGGKHAGDLPNVHVPQSGKLTIEVFAPGLTLSDGEESSLMDQDGSAVIIHSNADDYRSQPSGAAGSRIACGVVRAE